MEIYSGATEKAAENGSTQDRFILLLAAAFLSKTEPGFLTKVDGELKLSLKKLRKSFDFPLGLELPPPHPYSHESFVVAYVPTLSSFYTLTRYYECLDPVHRRQRMEDVLDQLETEGFFTSDMTGAFFSVLWVPLGEDTPHTAVLTYFTFSEPNPLALPNVHLGMTWDRLMLVNTVIGGQDLERGGLGPSPEGGEPALVDRVSKANRYINRLLSSREEGYDFNGEFSQSSALVRALRVSEPFTNDPLRALSSSSNDADAIPDAFSAANLPTLDDMSYPDDEFPSHSDQALSSSCYATEECEDMYIRQGSFIPMETLYTRRTSASCPITGRRTRHDALDISDEDTCGSVGSSFNEPKYYQDDFFTSDDDLGSDNDSPLQQDSKARRVVDGATDKRGRTNSGMDSLAELFNINTIELSAEQQQEQKDNESVGPREIINTFFFNKHPFSGSQPQFQTHSQRASTASDSSRRASFIPFNPCVHCVPCSTQRFRALNERDLMLSTTTFKHVKQLPSDDGGISSKTTPIFYQSGLRLETIIPTPGMGDRQLVHIGPHQTNDGVTEWFEPRRKSFNISMRGVPTDYPAGTPDTLKFGSDLPPVVCYQALLNIAERLVRERRLSHFDLSSITESWTHAEE